MYLFFKYKSAKIPIAAVLLVGVMLIRTLIKQVFPAAYSIANPILLGILMAYIVYIVIHYVVILIIAKRNNNREETSLK